MVATPRYTASDAAVLRFCEFILYQQTIVIGAREGDRTLDLDVGNVALYQLSYSRIVWRRIGESNPSSTDRQSAAFPVSPYGIVWWSPYGTTR